MSRLSRFHVEILESTGLLMKLNVSLVSNVEVVLVADRVHVWSNSIRLESFPLLLQVWELQFIRIKGKQIRLFATFESLSSDFQNYT